MYSIRWIQNVTYFLYKILLSIFQGPVKMCNYLYVVWNIILYECTVRALQAQVTWFCWYCTYYSKLLPQIAYKAGKYMRYLQGIGSLSFVQGDLVCLVCGNKLCFRVDNGDFLIFHQNVRTLLSKDPSKVLPCWNISLPQGSSYLKTQEYISWRII